WVPGSAAVGGAKHPRACSPEVKVIGIVWISENSSHPNPPIAQRFQTLAQFIPTRAAVHALEQATETCGRAVDTFSRCVNGGTVRSDRHHGDRGTGQAAADPSSAAVHALADASFVVILQAQIECIRVSGIDAYRVIRIGKVRVDSEDIVPTG